MSILAVGVSRRRCLHLDDPLTGRAGRSRQAARPTGGPCDSDGVSGGGCCENDRPQAKMYRAWSLALRGWLTLAARDPKFRGLGAVRPHVCIQLDGRLESGTARS